MKGGSQPGRALGREAGSDAPAPAPNHGPRSAEGRGRLHLMLPRGPWVRCQGQRHLGPSMFRVPAQHTQRECHGQRHADAPWSPNPETERGQSSPSLALAPCPGVCRSVSQLVSPGSRWLRGRLCGCGWKWAGASRRDPPGVTRPGEPACSRGPGGPRGPASLLQRNVLHSAAGDEAEPHELGLRLEERSGGDGTRQSAGLSASPPLVLSAQGTFLSTSSSVEHECSGLFVFF